MFQSLKEAKQYAESENINWIDIKFSDLEGQWRHVTLPVNDNSWYLFENSGIGFDASSVKLQTLENADMVLKPIWDTGFIDPFFKSKTLSFISEAIDVNFDEPSLLDPRQTAKRAIEFVKNQGISDEPLFAPEYEFYLFEKVKFQKDNYGCGYKIFPQKYDNDSDELDLGVHDGYHRTPPFDKHLEFRTRVSEILISLGVPIHYHHHEVGGSGQGEFEVQLTPLLKACDHGMLVKYVSQQIANQMGLSITFMPKPIGNHPGSGLHCHQTLFNKGKNIFWDEKGFAGLSKTAHHYIAGILDNGKTLAGLTNPSINSFHRLIPGFEAPTKMFFSPGNRSAAIRIPKYAKTEKDQRIEFRTPDATANIYFLMASQLMAGADGIINKKDPTELGFGPVTENIFTWSEEKLKTLKSFPSSLEDSFNYLKNYHGFLTEGGVFAEQFFDKWIELKMEYVKKLKGIPHPLEIEMYYNV
jgi:glutamine synthetase